MEKHYGCILIFNLQKWLYNIICYVNSEYRHILLKWLHDDFMEHLINDCGLNFGIL